MTSFWLMRAKRKCGGQCLGKNFKEKGLILLSFLVGWNVDKMARAQAAILDYEEGHES